MGACSDDCCSDGGYCPGSAHNSTNPKSDLSCVLDFDKLHLITSINVVRVLFMARNLWGVIELIPSEVGVPNSGDLRVGKLDCNCRKLDCNCRKLDMRSAKY